MKIQAIASTPDIGGLSKVRLPLLLALILATGGCASLQPVERGDDPDFSSVMPPEPLPPEENNGAIFQPATADGLFADYKAHRVGDVLQVILAESTQASKSSSTSSSKDSQVGMEGPTLLGRGVTHDGRPVLDTQINGSRGFEGEADSAQSNQLDGSISVMVSEVLPNGNLIIQGEKWLQINQGEEYIRLRGIVRPVDIRADNTVLSTQVASAQVAYGGRGTLADSNSPGWLTRFFNSPVWPF